MLRIILIIAIALIVLVPLLLLLGLQIQPRPFATYPDPSPPMTTVPLPDDLPPPGASFYQAVMRDQVPVINSAVITTRGKLRLAGITFPHRFRITHDAGQGYRHYIEATLFGASLMKINRSMRGEAQTIATSAACGTSTLT